MKSLSLLIFIFVSLNAYSQTGPTLSVDEANRKVGINNSTPSTTLDVNGSATFQGDIIVRDDKAVQAKIYSNGHIRAREITVDKETIPDYVFGPQYDLRTLEELEEYINLYKHLPEVPSACEYEERDGVNVGELQLILLKKIEELTLYILEQDKRIAELEKRVEIKQ